MESSPSPSCPARPRRFDRASVERRWRATWTRWTKQTTKQIRALRDEALLAGDSIQVDLCDVVLSGEDSDGTGTTLGTPCSLEYAQCECERVIAEVEVAS